ncbi:hypothetical protein [Dehalobacterium formicoaceticum]|uniref:Uncharacterized protein n=1 Tax=Dehalobacterium formicoaceticum TaxID=51515 RepID=A0ABT1Y8E7_9FIRM|nr:hypothetical protein [Dehalobacterium formicoaceticum]MCR6546833.1 hypothetical protein [Dehalobacterium formicoaceticum]
MSKRRHRHHDKQEKPNAESCNQGDCLSCDRCFQGITNLIIILIILIFLSQIVDEK